MAATIKLYLQWWISQYPLHTHAHARIHTHITGCIPVSAEYTNKNKDICKALFQWSPLVVVIVSQATDQKHSFTKSSLHLYLTCVGVFLPLNMIRNSHDLKQPLGPPLTQVDFRDPVNQLQIAQLCKNHCTRYRKVSDHRTPDQTRPFTHSVDRRLRTPPPTQPGRPGIHMTKQGHTGPCSEWTQTHTHTHTQGRKYPLCTVYNMPV